MVTVALDQSRRSEIAHRRRKSNLDGSFGKRTEAALVAFQTAHKETYSTKEPDKKCGKKTRAALIAAVKAL